MAKKEKKPDTLKQKRARHYVKIILGVYLIYTAYSIVKDMHAGVAADRPTLFYATAAVFLAVGAVLAITSFRAAMKISAEELRQEEAGQQEPDLQEQTKSEDDAQNPAAFEQKDDMKSE